jgi:hypothetical protein
MDQYVLKEITKYLVPSRVFMLEIQHLKNKNNCGRWNYVFSDLDKLATYFCDWYQKNILGDHPFYVKGADNDWNGPIDDYDQRSNFHQFLAQGYHSGYLNIYHQDHLVYLSLNCLAVNPTY